METTTFSTNKTNYSEKATQVNMIEYDFDDINITDDGWLFLTDVVNKLYMLQLYSF